MLHKENYAKEFGARPVKKAIQKTVEDMIIEHGEEINN
jgi:ATP-dependent Clp protease ATP-binding subunit ClpA